MNHLERRILLSWGCLGVMLASLAIGISHPLLSVACMIGFSLCRKPLKRLPIAPSLIGPFYAIVVGGIGFLYLGSFLKGFKTERMICFIGVGAAFFALLAIAVAEDYRLWKMLGARRAV